MTAKVTTVQTDYARTLTVSDFPHTEGEVYLKVDDTDMHTSISTALTTEEAATLGKALLGDSVTVITDLPEAKLNHHGYVEAGNTDRHQLADADYIEEQGKALLAIAKFIRAKNAEKAEAEAALKIEVEALKAVAAQKAVVKLTKRRDALVQELTDSNATAYAWASELAKSAIDRVIELEDALAPVPF